MAAGLTSPVWKSLVTEGTPSPRAGHTVSYSRETKECLVFGGASHENGFFSDVQVLDLATLKWRLGVSQDATTSPAVPARYEHAAALVQRQDRPPHLLVMYGAGEDGLRDDVWELDLGSYRWTAFQTKGNRPVARTLHSCGHVVLQSPKGKADRLYVFGGGLTVDRAVPDSNVYCLDVDSLLWIQVTSPRQQPVPLPRLGHSLTAVGSKVYMFGGMDRDTSFDELWVFDTVSNRWSQPATQGERPSARSGHTATALGNKLCIFGGFDKQPQPVVYDDLYILDTETLQWSKPPVAALPPGPPCGLIDHDACCIPAKQLDEIENARRPADDTTVEHPAFKERLLLFGDMDLSGIYNGVFELEL